MNNIKNSVILIGSPRCEKSNSNSLGSYMQSQLEFYNVSVEKYYLYNIMNHKEKIDDLFLKINESDLIILVFPLYFDCFPVYVLKMMELLFDYRKSLKDNKKNKFAVIVNCGFPEASKNKIALKICKNFVNEIRFEWNGGLSIGAGEVIGTRQIEKIKGILKNLKKGFKIAAKALAEGKSIPQQATELVSKPLIPKFIYLKSATLSFKKEAKKYGTKKILRSQPYLKNN
ncbi:MAG: NAD(P)H-dependent oxidoreductase [Candidatus Lokiarchaeota archaeon]|nr:NAD(P)H-dependent oxidoreductase [Candidatus Lokiarchaeota archaeon]